MSLGAHLFWLAPLLPLAVFAVLASGLSRNGRLAAGLAVAGAAGSLAVSVLGLFASAEGARMVVGIPWLEVGGYRLELALWLNPLGMLVATLVSVVGLIVLIYAVSYMADDPRPGRFFAELSLFLGAMLALVLAADLLTLFIAWELVGLCSYLLIGFWFEKPEVPTAATKAFITYPHRRSGDADRRPAPGRRRRQRSHRHRADCFQHR
jgi:NADH-quinone oxidoreductase subunit L